MSSAAANKEEGKYDKASDTTHKSTISNQKFESQNQKFKIQTQKFESQHQNYESHIQDTDQIQPERYVEEENIRIRVKEDEESPRESDIIIDVNENHKMIKPLVFEETVNIIISDDFQSDLPKPANLLMIWKTNKTKKTQTKLYQV